MIGVEPVGGVGARLISDLVASAARAGSNEPAARNAGVGFEDLIGKGVAEVEQKIAAADDLVRSFALGGDVPIHQVTVAIEEARLAVELALQVRTRLVEAYREIMNTQL